MRQPPQLNLLSDDRLTRYRNMERYKSFGYGGLNNASSPTLLIYAGRVRIGANAYIDVAEDEVALSGDPCFVALRYSFSDKSAEWVGAGSTEPVSDNDYYYESYFKVEQVDTGSYVLSTPGLLRFGDMVIPGAFGDG